MCNDNMPVSVKVYFGHPAAAIEIRRFIFRPEQQRSGSSGVFQALVDRIRALFNGLNLHDVHLCWKDDDGDYVVFSTDDELRVAINSTTDNTLRIYIREKELPVRSNHIGHSNAATSSTAGPPAAVSLASRRSVDQAPAHISSHQVQYRRSARSGSSSRDRDLTPSGGGQSGGSGRMRSALPPAVDPCKEFDQLHLEEEVLMVGVEPPGSPSMLNNHVGERQNCRPSANADDGSKESVSPISPPSATVCNECRGEGRGVFYRCTVCPDFHLCSECENRGLHDQHIMVRIAIGGSHQGTPNFFRR